MGRGTQGERECVRKKMGEKKVRKKQTRETGVVVVG